MPRGLGATKGTITGLGATKMGLGQQKRTWGNKKGLGQKKILRGLGAIKGTIRGLGAIKGTIRGLGATKEDLGQ